MNNPHTRRGRGPIGRSFGGRASARLAALAACFVVAACGGSDEVAQGRIVVTQQACGSCHRIAGAAEANGTVGPSLSHFGSQRLIAGVLVNNPENLARFLRSPGSYVKNGAMPEQVLDEARLRAAAAYLETLR